MAVERAQILEAAVRVLVEDPAASMQAIADAAGIGRATLHRASPGRQDLLRSIALTAAADAERLVAAARPEADSALAALARVVAALVPIGHRYSFLGQEPAFATDPELGVAHADERVKPWDCRDMLRVCASCPWRQRDLPYADAAVPPVLLEHPRLARCKTRWEFAGEMIQGGVDVRVRAQPRSRVW